MIEAIITRLKTKAPLLGNRVEGAASLSAFLQNNVRPQHSPFAFVIPAGISSAGPLESAVGLHRQRLTRAIEVCWVVDYAGSSAGGEAVAGIAAIESEIITALTGFTPVAGQGALRLTRSLLSDQEEGTFFFQSSFTFDDHLRIMS